MGAGFPTRGRGRGVNLVGAEAGRFSFGSLRESDCDDGDAERCRPILGLFTPAMVTDSMHVRRGRRLCVALGAIRAARRFLRQLEAIDGHRPPGRPFQH